MAKFLTFYQRGFAVISHISYAFLHPHGSTTYTDAACCYRPSSVGLSVCLSVTLLSPAKTAEAIEMRFGLRTRGPKEAGTTYYTRSRIPHEKGNFEVETGELL